MRLRKQKEELKEKKKRKKNSNNQNNTKIMIKTYGHKIIKMLSTHFFGGCY